MSAGKNMKLMVGNTACKITRYDGPLKSQKLDITNSESGGFGEYEGGVFDGDISFTIQWRLADGTFSLFTPGSNSSVVFFPYRATTTTNTTGTLFVETYHLKGEVRGIVTADVTGSFTGTWTSNAQ